MIKKNKIKFKKYKENQKQIQRRIHFEKDVAENVNRLIAIFNNEFAGFNMNSSIFINIVLRDYFSYLKTLDKNEAMEILKNNLIVYTVEGKDDE